jgi:hypothetical protein
MAWPTHWAWRTIIAGVLAAAVMALVMMTVMASRGLGFWTFLNVIGATFPSFRPPSAGFDPVATFAGTFMHLLTGAVWALPYGVVAWAIAPRMVERYLPAVFTGVLWGALVYLLMGRLIGRLIDPAVAMLPQGLYVVAHLVFGGVMAAVIAAGARREARITFAPGVPVEETITSPWR